MTNKTLNKRVAELRSLEAQIADLTKQAENVKAALKKELDAQKVDSIDTGLHRIFYYAYEKKSVDTAKLKASNLYDAFSKVQTVTQFKITDVKNA